MASLSQDDAALLARNPAAAALIDAGVPRAEVMAGLRGRNSPDRVVHNSSEHRAAASDGEAFASDGAELERS